MLSRTRFLKRRMLRHRETAWQDAARRSEKKKKRVCVLYIEPKLDFIAYHTTFKDQRLSWITRLRTTPRVGVWEVSQVPSRQTEFDFGNSQYEVF